MFCEKCGSPVEGEQTLCSNCAAEQAAPAEEITENVLPTDDAFELNTPDTVEKKPRKKKRGLIAAIVAAVLVIACALGVVFNLDRIKGFAGRTFQSPEDYFVDVEKAAIAQYSDQLTQSYGKLLSSYDENAEAFNAFNAEISLTLGEDILSLLESSLQQQGMEMEADWLEKIRLSLSTNVQGSATEMTVAAGLGENDLLTADVILDTEGNKLYAAIPQLNNEYISVDVSSVLSAAELKNMLSQSTEMSDKLIKALPTETVLNDLINAYVEIALTGITNVEKQNQDVAVNGVSQKMVVLTAKVSEADLINIAQNILRKAQNDQQLKDVFSGLSDYVNDMGEQYGEYYEPVDLVQEFSDAVDEALESLESYKEEVASGNYMALKTYVDMENNVRGHELSVYENGEPVSDPISWMTAVDGDKTAMRAELGKVTITGEKTESKSASKSSYVLYVEEEKIGTLEFETQEDLTNTLRLIPSEELVAELLSESDIPSALITNNIALELSYGTSVSGKEFCEIGIIVSDKTLIKLSLSAEATTGGDITIPTDAVNIVEGKDIVQWVKNVNLDKFITAMENADVPQSLVDLVRNYSGMLQLVG